MPYIKPEQLAYLDTSKPLNNIMAHIDALQVAQKPQQVQPTKQQTQNLVKLSMLALILEKSGDIVFDQSHATYHYTRHLWHKVANNGYKLTQIQLFFKKYQNKQFTLNKIEEFKNQLDPETYTFFKTYYTMWQQIDQAKHYDELSPSLIDDLDYLQTYQPGNNSDYKIFLIHLKSDPDYIYQVMPMVASVIHPDQNKSDLHMHVYPKTELPNLIYQNLNDPKIRSDNPILKQLQQLWSLQNNQTLTTCQPIDPKFNIINQIYHQLDFNDQHQSTSLRPSEIAQFFNEYQHHHLTQATSHIQYWLSNQDENEYLNIITHDQNADRLANMQIVDPQDSQYANIQKLISSVNNKYQLITAIKLQDTPNIDAPHHLTAIHGTVNQSIIPILLNGLKPAQELDQQKIDYVFSGNALGNGVYFTDPQVDIQRSVSFTDINFPSSMTNSTQQNIPAYHLLFVADIAYHQMCVTNKYDDLPNNDADLIRAKDVGTSTLSDELVARHSNQIQLKYLLIIKERTA